MAVCSVGRFSLPLLYLFSFLPLRLAVAVFGDAALNGRDGLALQAFCPWREAWREKGIVIKHVSRLRNQMAGDGIFNQEFSSCPDLSSSSLTLRGLNVMPCQCNLILSPNSCLEFNYIP